MTRAATQRPPERGDGREDPGPTAGAPAAAAGLTVNRQELLARGRRGLREAALAIVEAGIARGDPAVGTHAKVRRAGSRLWVDGDTYDLASVRNIWVVGAGKASMPIAAALEDILGDRIAGGVIVTKANDRRRLKRIDVIEAAHPVPDENSVRGGLRILELASAAADGDLVFAAVTGGSTSLAVVPPEGIALADLQALYDLLLQCGEPIEVVNVVRRHLCLLKGGRLVQAIQPALALTLTLDTAPDGMPWPDMCLPDPTTCSHAVEVLARVGLWDRVPPAIRAHLVAGVGDPRRDTVKDFAGLKARTVFVGDPVSVCDAAAARAAQLGFVPVVLGAFIRGEAREVATAMGGIAREILERGRPAAAPCALISGGETTVTLPSDAGRGGPNQEFALAFAVAMAHRGPFACACLDTDGTDGPTQIAGGLTDDTSLSRAGALACDLDDALRRHASSDALEKLGDAVVTGHTGTNLQNIRAIVLGSPQGDLA